MYMLNMLIFYSHVSLPEGMLIYSLLMAQLMLRNLHGGHCWDGENRPLLRLQGTADADGFSWRLIETNQSFHISGRSQNPQELLVHPKDGTVFWEKKQIWTDADGSFGKIKQFPEKSMVFSVVSWQRHGLPPGGSLSLTTLHGFRHIGTARLTRTWPSVCNSNIMCIYVYNVYRYIYIYLCI